MYEITKEFKFSAGHFLNGLPDTHQCSRQHGHNYLVEICLRSDRLNEVGFIVDYGDLADFKQIIDSQYDHRNLNDFLDFNPTAENLAQKFFAIALDLPWGNNLSSITVKETDGTSAVYYE